MSDQVNEKLPAEADGRATADVIDGASGAVIMNVQYSNKPHQRS